MLQLLGLEPQHPFFSRWISAQFYFDCASCFSFFFRREEFRYDQGSKSGASLLTGASGATRKGQRKNGEWHGRTTFTAQDGESRQEEWDMGRKISGGDE